MKTILTLIALLLALFAAIHADDAPKLAGEVSTAPLMLKEGGTAEKPSVFDGKGWSSTSGSM